jgi:hypothetical protein
MMLNRRGSLAALLAALGCAALLVGCRGKTPDPEPVPAAPNSAALTRPEPALALPGQERLEPKLPWRLPAVDRVVAIGDVHGDLAALRAALRLAGATDAKDTWVGGKLVVVQTGDQLDRGDEERAILDLLERISAQARAAGGALHVLNGNHELLNALGDFRYVTPAGYETFRDVAPTTANQDAVSRLPERARGRGAAFLPGGPYASKLAERNLVLQVGKTVFVHGGVLPAHVEAGLGTINEEARAFLRGELPRPPAAVTADDSVTWTRAYSDGEPSADICQTLGRVLKALEAERMVVGHTVQRRGIDGACGDRVWRIDVGMSKMYGGRPAALEITPAGTRAIVLP